MRSLHVQENKTYIHGVSGNPCFKISDTSDTFNSYTQLELTSKCSAFLVFPHTKIPMCCVRKITCRICMIKIQSLSN